MQPKAKRDRLLLLGFALGLFGGFVSASSVHGQIVRDGSSIIMSQVLMPQELAFAKLEDETLKINGSDSKFTEVHVDMPDDFGVALEDSVELFRADIRRSTCRLDGGVMEPKVSAKVVSNRHSDTSPPLLV
jgi:hypothetical protein